MIQLRTGPELAAICARLELSEEAAALLRPEHDERGFVRALLDAEQFADAVRFMSFALPTREAIWWAWTCARRTLQPEPPAGVTAALGITERWIAQPAEGNRRPALAIAETAGAATPAGAAALAVFFSGGSIAPPDVPPVPPPAGGAAQAIAGSVTLSAVSPPPEKAPERFRQFVEQAMEVAVRIQLWPPA
jgi:hypothetical protein